VSIIYGALSALAQRDVKRIVGFASISHLGFIVLGIFSLNVDGLNGAIIQMVNHGIIIAALFICVGVYETRFATRDLRELGGLAKPMPIMAGLFLIAALAGLGMPLMNSFVGEFLTLLGAFQVSPAWAVLASLGVVLACWYMLRLYQGVTQGRLRLAIGQVEEPAAKAVARIGRLDAGVVELAVLGPLVALIVLIGVYPGPVIRYTRFTAGQYVSAVDRGAASTAAPATTAAP